MRLIWFFSFFFLSSSVLAKGSEDLLEVLSPIHSLRANFVQVILDAKGKPLQKSEGKVQLQRPGQFRWEVKRPVSQLIIANHSRLWIYDPDLEQVVIRPVAKEIGNTPAFLLSNVNVAIEKDFTVKKMPAPQHWQWFSLSPKTADSLFTVIQLGFQDREIKELRMRDNLGHHTVIQFKQVQQNLFLSSALFQFHPPVHVDVIDETRK